MSHAFGIRSRNAGTLLLTAALLFLSSVVGAADSLQDGPYVIQSADGRWVSRWVEGDADSPRVREQSIKLGDAVTISGVGALPAFEVKLRGDATIAPDAIKVSTKTPLFVIADTHGEFAIAVRLLQSHHIIDDGLRWSFGKGHLAILGDVFDRGPNQTELLWLFYKLEEEAARAGGGVHLALGNHEAMVLDGDDRYLNPKYRHVAAALEQRAYADLWDERSLLGRWLRTKAAVFRLGDYLCLHGGVSRELIDRGLTLAQINAAVRESLRESPRESLRQALSKALRDPSRRPPIAASERVQLVMGNSGPLWYRGYFAEEAHRGDFRLAEPADIDLILDTFKAQRILVGHTMVPTVTPLYDGRVIAVQVYPHRDKETNAPVMEGLSIQRGQLFRARIDGGREPLPLSPAH